MATQLELEERISSFEGNADPFITEALRNTAAAMVEQAANVQPGQNVLLWFDAPSEQSIQSIQLIKELRLRCLAKGANISFFMRDLDHDAQAISGATPDEIHHLFDEEERLVNEADVMLIVRGPEHPEAMKEVALELKTAYIARYSQIHQRRVRGEVDWTLMLWPTAYEAGKERLPEEVYFREYMEACNQPWRAIKEAQGKLKTVLDEAETIEFYANEDDPNLDHRTHVTMSIKDMTFCNSTIDSNYPGSEVFSAPVLHTVNGQIFAEGEYEYNGVLMKNILLKIKNGKIFSAHADEGNDGLQQILNNGEGARYFGEVALGTNPGLTRRFFNALLNEKVGGSFHMAIGHCYEYDQYGGEPVKVNNGNTEDKTSNHWDLTILMHRKADGSGGGRVVVDGTVIQNDGKFLDPALDILNSK